MPEGWAQWLLIRRSVTTLEEVAFYRAFGPEHTPVADLARVAGTRWTIEEGFQHAKEVGLDQYEVRRWEGWYRHVTLCLLAQAFLAVTRATTQTGAKGGMTAA
jgi:SRSO17 transposase